ncbi:MAG: hypothetical protein K2F87_00805 [Muribaculaceae bacterium]|nr:hypothetical protein [Muribaculaceae bacterium]
MKKTLLTLTVLGLASLTAAANEHTFVFDGENAMFGVDRQTTLDVAELKFSEEISGTEAGVDFSIKKVSETGNGFALVNAGGANAGLLVQSAFSSATHVTPEISLTVPGGKISEVKLWMSGTALSSLAISFNGKFLDPGDPEGGIFPWVWQGLDETVTFTWDNTYYNRFIHSIEVTYTEDLHGKKECGLAFTAPAVEAIMGQDIKFPALLNPNKLPVTWTSADEAVATVNSEGVVTLIKGGKTMIVVTTEGNDEYAPGNARYDLSVVPSASNLKEMRELAPNLYDRVYVNFPMTVTYANLTYAFVIDAEDNAGDICDTRDMGTSTTPKTIYQVGEVIPEGWIASNGMTYGSIIWQGQPGKVTETVEVTYPAVTVVTPEDVDRVVTLLNVTFAGATPMEKGYGTTEDGTRYEFQNTYSLPPYPAGKYDVTAIVHYAVNGSTIYFYLAPIAYAESSSVEVSGIAAENEEAVYYDLQGRRVENPAQGLFIKSQGGKFTKVVRK